MRIEHWKYERVEINGDVLDELGRICGNVVTKVSITVSDSEGGCDWKNCRCSDGHWICINFGYENSTVSGVTVYFNNWQEMEKSLFYGQYIRALKN